MVCTRLSILTTVGWLFVNEAKTCCNISRTWKHIFLSGSVTRQDFRRPTPNHLGIDELAGSSCRVTANPTGISLPITDIKTAVLRSQSCQNQKFHKNRNSTKKNNKTLGLSLALLGLHFACVFPGRESSWNEIAYFQMASSVGMERVRVGRRIKERRWEMNMMDTDGLHLRLFD